MKKTKMKTLVDGAGKYLGAFGGLEQPDGEIKWPKSMPTGKDVHEVDTAPEHVTQIYDLKKKEWSPVSEDVRWGTVRLQRDEKLSDSDWTQLKDSPLTDEQKAAWVSYRQSLRDITDTFDNPEDVVWPDTP